MGKLQEHFIREFELAGWLKDGVYVEEMQRDLCWGLLRLEKAFSQERHSGTTASYTLDLFDRLARFKVITPLTGADDEWRKVGDDFELEFQNKRDGRVFKRKNGSAYILDDNEILEVIFPYTPN